MVDRQSSQRADSWSEELDDQRRLPRHQVLLPGRCRWTYEKADVTIVDINQHGCRIAARLSWIQPHCIVRLKPKGLDVIDASICWGRKSEFGLKFLRPLYEPVVLHLAGQHAPPATLEVPVFRTLDDL